MLPALALTAAGAVRTHLSPTPHRSTSREPVPAAPPRAPAVARGGGSSSSINWSDRTSEVGAASSGTDLLVWVVFLDGWDGTFTLWRAIFGLLLLGLPFAIGALVLSKCGAWLNDGSRRCKQPRSGFLRRCFDHRSQVVTWYDVWGGLSIAIGVLNVVLLILALSGGS